MLYQLIVLGMALGLNNALASVALGTMNISRLRQLAIACTFALFEAGMPILGIWLGSGVSHVLGSKAKFVGIFILVIIGIYSLLKSTSRDEGEPVNRLGLHTLMLAVALSLDNLSVGFALGVLSVSLWVAAITFGTVSLCMSLIGLEVGRFLGKKIHLSAEKLSGVVLLATAVIMLAH